MRTSTPVLFDQFGSPFAIQGAWKGARRSERLQTRGWSTSPGSPDEDNLGDLPTLRTRSRSLDRDNPLAGGAINTAEAHIVGTGLALRAEVDREILGWDETRAITFQKTAERYFNIWARTKAADLTLTLDHYEQQSLGLRTVLLSGDALALITYRKHSSSPFGTCVQLIEGDRLGNEKNQPDSTTLTGGVMLDSHGAPWGYHVMDQHPGARIGVSLRTWSKVPAFTASGRRACLHLFNSLRPEQHRGVPYLAPVIEALKELGEYTDGELRAAVVSGLYTVGITSPAPDGDLPGTGASDDNDETGDAFTLGYGAVNYLDAGEKIETYQPNRPNVAFDPFVLAVLRQIGVRLEIPYEILIKHFTASYSASRAALLEMTRFVRRRRYWLAANFCQPVYEAVLEEVIALGYLEAPGFFEDPLLRLAYSGANWVGDSMGQIDPRKEGEAWKLMVDEGFATKGEATATLTGGDYDRNVEIRAYEQRRERELGIVAPAPSGSAPPAKPDEPPEEPPPNPDQPEEEDPS
jgi:lambda family phage portal protein